MTPDEILSALDAAVVDAETHLALVRRKADKAASKKGARCEYADRLCDWREHRRDEARALRAAVTTLLAEARQ